MRLRRLLAFGLLVVASADAASAQTGQAPTPPTWRAYYLFDSTAMAAPLTFDAVLQKTRLVSRGGGFEVTDLWRGAFARVAVSRFDESGSRVVVFGRDVVRLGIPLRLKMRPIEVGGGWRLGAWAGGRVVPYGGAVLLHVHYDERSDFADPIENVRTTVTGHALFGGLEVRIAPWAIAGAEVQWRSLPNGLDGSGVASVFRESDLGGTSMRVLVGIRP